MVLSVAIKKSLVLGSFVLLVSVQSAFAQQYKNERYASLERSKDAVGHYARARAMLVRALQEFEEGRKLARPDLLLDAEEWRLSVISRAEELNRVLDPQPKVVRSGTRFSASPLQVERTKQLLPPLEIGPADNNTQGEDDWKREKEIAAVKARMSEVSKEYAPQEPQIEQPEYLAPEALEQAPQEEVAAPVKNDEQPSEEKAAEAGSDLSVGDIIPGDLTIPEAEVDKSADSAEQAPTLFGVNPVGEKADLPAPVEVKKEAAKKASAEVNTDTNYDDDAAVSQAIERSIKERLNKINGGEN